jgi:hypothetical protein
VSLRRKLRRVSYKGSNPIPSFEGLIDEVPTYFARSPKNRYLHIDLPRISTTVHL